ncbi:hypothetical protein KIL84_017683 [Mauremys mutica]|uniref:Uncharacterized protein n=1 Tax=Mauremys mutica TaxID=74926 RepID=A0A9D3X1K6_9SAUR|nr:hypothetical protein KIL84_017683 [Mauremys mutica]
MTTFLTERWECQFLLLVAPFLQLQICSIYLQSQMKKALSGFMILTPRTVASRSLESGWLTQMLSSTLPGCLGNTGLLQLQETRQPRCGT